MSTILDSAIRTQFVPTEEGGTVVSTQNEEPILELNRTYYNMWGDKRTFGKMGEGYVAATIPKLVLEQWRKETNGDIDRDPMLMAKYLNAPENRKYRRTPTTV